METFKKATIKVIVNICPTEGDIWFALLRHVYKHYSGAFMGVMGVQRSQTNYRKAISWFHALSSTLTQYFCE